MSKSFLLFAILWIAAAIGLILTVTNPTRRMALVKSEPEVLKIPDKPSLAILMTGQLRTFFTDTVQSSLKQFLQRLQRQHQVSLFMILNSDQVPDFPDYGVPVHCVLFDHKYFHRVKDMLLSKPSFDSFCTFHDTQEVEVERRQLELPNARGWMLAAGIIQFAQLFHGMDVIEAAETERQRKFDFILRTRFDVQYDDAFVPCFDPQDTFLNRYLPHSAKQRSAYQQACRERGWDEQMYHMAKVPPLDDRLRVPKELLPLNFGGSYYLQIQPPPVHDPKQILWCCNDWCIFSGRDVFMKLRHSFEMYDSDVVAMVKSLNIQLAACQEAQLILFCTYLKIPFVFLLDDTVQMVRAITSPP